MSTLTLLLYGGVTAMILAALTEAVRSLASRPVWELAAAGAVRQARLELVETVDRRRQQLPFVGQDRRRAQGAEVALPKVAQSGG